MGEEGGTLVVQVGQCGNAVGAAFWSLVARDLHCHGPQRLGGLVEEVETKGEAPALRARCVMVDTELKAVRSVVAGEAGGGLLRDAAAVCGHSGRGNNWAHGYRQPGEEGGGVDRNGEGACLRDALAAVRRSMERAGTSDMLLVHSLAGGSGSGLGSRLSEHLRQEYGARYLAHAAVAPRPDGDTPLQHYNVCMATQWLQAYSDGVLLFQNADLLRTLERALPSKRTGAGAGAGVVSFHEMNHYIGSCLAGTLLPYGGGAGADVRWPLRDIVTNVMPDPALKFAEVRTSLVLPPLGDKGRSRPAAAAPEAAESWAKCTHKLAAMVPRHDPLDGGRTVTSTAALVTLRGGGGGGGGGLAREVLPLLRKSGGYTPVGWAAPSSGATGAAATRDWAPVPHWVCREDAAAPLGGAVPRSLTVVANRSNVVGALSYAAGRAHVMLDAGAYAHWYERYDCPRAALRDAAHACTDVADAYRYYHQH